MDSAARLHPFAIGMAFAMHRGLRRRNDEVEAPVAASSIAWGTMSEVEAIAVPASAPVDTAKLISAHETEAASSAWEVALACGVGGCTEQFTSQAAYEAHYAACHRHVCATCKQVFSGDRLLSLHVSEAHDALFAVMASTGTKRMVSTTLRPHMFVMHTASMC